MKSITWQGVYPAITTKFTSDGQLDITAFLQHCKFLLDNGVHGIVIGGSLGESSTLTAAEKVELAHSALERYGNQTDILLNVAEGSTKAALALIKAAEKIGVHGLMTLPPMMYNANAIELVHYFKTLANHTQLPIMLYNNPIDYKNYLTIEVLQELVAVTNIQAIKESTRNISSVTHLRNQFGDRFKILCGVDTIAMEELVMGADGWVAGLVNAFPKETVAIYDLIKQGAYEEALSIHRWFMPLLELDVNPQLVQNIKLAEAMVGVGTEFVRPPRMPLSGAERNRVIGIIQSSLDNRPR